MPTPLVSWTVSRKKVAGGVVITASHNPAEFNGFKIKAEWGGSTSPDCTRAVESLIGRGIVKRTALTHSKTSTDRSLTDEAKESYRAQLSSYVDLERICSAHATVIIDPMHGAGGRWVESFLSNRGELHCETIRDEGDPNFGGVNPEPIDQHFGVLKSTVKETKAILGLATDGDADRLGAVNELGQTMTMHEVAPISLLHLARVRKITGGVVRTFSQSVLMKRIAAAHHLPLYEMPIGFKYIADLMLKENILIGAEESGGIGIDGHIPERDGILNSLLLLEAVITAGKTPSEIVSDIHWKFGKFYFGRLDVKMEVDKAQDLVELLASSPRLQLENTLLRVSKQSTEQNCFFQMNPGCFFGSREPNRFCGFIQKLPQLPIEMICSKPEN